MKVQDDLPALTEAKVHSQADQILAVPPLAWQPWRSYCIRATKLRCKMSMSSS